MSEQVHQRSFSFAFHNQEDGGVRVSFVQEFDQDPPEDFRKQMAEAARRTNEAGQAKGQEIEMAVKFQGRMFEMVWSSQIRDLAIIYAIEQLLGQTQERMRVYRTLVEALNPRQAGAVQIRPGRKQ